jgi:hypothetical protein
MNPAFRQLIHSAGLRRFGEAQQGIFNGSVQLLMIDKNCIGKHHAIGFGTLPTALALLSALTLLTICASASNH